MIKKVGSSYSPKGFFHPFNPGLDFCLDAKTRKKANFIEAPTFGKTQASLILPSLKRCIQGFGSSLTR